MSTHIRIGSFLGIPILLDMFFVLIIIIAYYPFWTSGNTQLMSVGLLIATGVFLSILLHEVGHALAGRLFKQRVTQIELTGLGGITQFERSLTPSVLARSVIFLAGPAANLLLWQAFGALEAYPGISQRRMLLMTVDSLSVINFWLMAFNLLPAFPLDGGRTLDAWLGKLISPVWSVRIVALLGLFVTIAIVAWALPSNIWLLLVALFLGQFNWAALQSVGGIGGRR